MALIVIDVDTRSSGISVEQPRHVLDAVDRDPGLADLALGARMVGVEAHLRRQVEGGRQPGLPVLQQVAEPPVRVVGGSHAGVLAHRPQPAPVHRRVGAARVREDARLAQLGRRIEPGIRLVDGQLLDAGVGRVVVVHPRVEPIGWRRSATCAYRRRMDIVNPEIETYMAGLQARHDEPVLLEMEAEGRERGFPIVGRNVGVTLEVLARSIGARRVMELGSGFGYSAYWFARAVGAGGEVHCTDGDPDNATKAESYLTRAGLWDRVTYHVGDAVEQMARRRRRLRHRLRRHRQARVPRRLARGARADPRRRPLHLRQRAVVGPDPGTRPRPQHERDPRAQPADRRRRAVRQHDRADPRRRDRRRAHRVTAGRPAWDPGCECPTAGQRSGLDVPQ